MFLDLRNERALNYVQYVELQLWQYAEYPVVFLPTSLPDQSEEDPLRPRAVFLSPETKSRIQPSQKRASDCPVSRRARYRIAAVNVLLTRDVLESDSAERCWKRKALVEE
jgi:hypothetical protein